MSKIQLKKELSNMSKDQIIELVLDLYSARKEIKDYLEFFLNPDINKLLDGFKKNVDKEMRRSKWGSSKARSSQLKKFVKDFISYSPGFEAIANAHIYLIREIVYWERFLNYPNTLNNLLNFLTKQIIEMGREEQMLDLVVNAIDSLINDETLGRQYYRRQLKEIVTDILNSIKSSLK